MRPVVRTLSSATFSDWIVLDSRRANQFAVGLGVIISSGASLTYSVQHTFDNVFTQDFAWSGSRTTTTLTVTKVAHKLTAADWIRIDAPSATPILGEYAVAGITDADTFTVTVVNSGSSSTASGVAGIHTARVLPHETLAAKTVSDDGNYAFPPFACRLILTAWTSGSATLTVIQAG